MKLFYYGKDGGAESHVWGYWLCEFKRLFSVVLLRFEDGSREAFHSHAFNSFNWLLSGHVNEEYIPLGEMEQRQGRTLLPSWHPIYTPRTRFHRVTSSGRSWVLSIRGPWAKTWLEYLPIDGRIVTLTHGRREVA